MLEKFDMAQSETEKWFHEPSWLWVSSSFLALSVGTSLGKLSAVVLKSLGLGALVSTQYLDFYGFPSALHYLIINPVF